MPLGFVSSHKVPAAQLAPSALRTKSTTLGQTLRRAADEVDDFRPRRGPSRAGRGGVDQALGRPSRRELWHKVTQGVTRFCEQENLVYIRVTTIVQPCRKRRSHRR